jgi:AraC-like DNA-binding protein
LVVKKGSNARLATSGGMPLPVSEMDKRTYWPGAEVGISRSAFAERFTRTMGEPPMRYFGKQRLRLAAQRLRSFHEPVAKIGFETGYDSEAAFSRAFKREFGVAPAAWRARSADDSSW